MGKPTRKARRALKRGEKAAVNRAVNDLAAGKMTNKEFILHGKKMGRLFDRAIKGKRNPPK